MTITPYDWQIRDMLHLRANGHTGLLALEAGGGKTVSACLAIKDSGAKTVLIVAPKSTHRTAWADTVAEIVEVVPQVIGRGNKAERAALANFELGFEGVYVTTPQLLTRSDVSAWRGDMLVVDEVHQVSTPKSKAQRKISGYSFQDGEPLARRFRHRLALSGTPFRQQFENMWSIMRLLWPELNESGMVAYDNFYGWQNQRQSYEDIVTGFEWVPVAWTNGPIPANAYRKVVDGVPCWGKAKTAKKWLAESQPGRLLSEMPCVVMHKRRERCCDTPEHANGFLKHDAPQVITRSVEMTCNQVRAIRDMEEHMVSWLQENPLVAEISLTQQQRIRQMTLGEASVATTPDGKDTLEYALDCTSPMIDEVLHILSNLPTDEPVVIFLESQRFAAVLVHRLNAAGVVTEEYSGKRKADLSRFGTDYQVLVGVTSAIGTGTDGLGRIASTEIWVEQPVSLTMQAQGQARLDRMGSKAQVQRYVLLDDLGIQEGRMSDNLAKQLLINKSLRRIA